MGIRDALLIFERFRDALLLTRAERFLMSN